MNSLHDKKRGMSLIEIVIAASLILTLSVAFTGAYLYSEAGTEESGQRIRANLLAEEGLEAARNIRDGGYANLAVGTFGLSTTTGSWVLTGSNDTNDIFTRTITVSTVNAVTKQVTSTVTWPEDALRTGSTTLTTYLTNTQLLSPQANKLVVTTNLATLLPVLIGLNLGSELEGITIQNIGSSAITINKIEVSWSNSTGNHIIAIVINGTTDWSSTGTGTPTGAQSTGTTLTILPVTLSSGSGIIPINYFEFDGVMLLNVYTLTFTMGDGSTKTVSTLQL